MKPCVFCGGFLDNKGWCASCMDTGDYTRVDKKIHPRCKICRAFRSKNSHLPCSRCARNRVDSMERLDKRIDEILDCDMELKPKKPAKKQSLLSELKEAFDDPKRWKTGSEKKLGKPKKPTNKCFSCGELYVDVDFLNHVCKPKNTAREDWKEAALGRLIKQGLVKVEPRKPAKRFHVKTPKFMHRRPAIEMGIIKNIIFSIVNGRLRLANAQTDKTEYLEIIGNNFGDIPIDVGTRLGNNKLILEKENLKKPAKDNKYWLSPSGEYLHSEPKTNKPVKKEMKGIKTKDFTKRTLN